MLSIDNHQVLPLLNTMERLLESPEEWELPVSPDKVFPFLNHFLFCSSSSFAC